LSSAKTGTCMRIEYKRNRTFGIKSLPNLPLVEKHNIQIEERDFKFENVCYYVQFYGKLAGKQSKNKLQLNFPIKEIYQIDIVQLYESKLFECTIEMRIETLNYFERLTSD
ncbi:hypothetical protein T12_103, partial [Trichinella patagoniensis]